MVRDERTGRTRRIFQTLDNRRDGGFEETMGVNRNAGHDLYPLSAMTKARQREVKRKRTKDLRKWGLPLGLYVPGSCGSSLFYHNIFRGSFQKRLQDLQTDEECSWLDPDRDTTWKAGLF